MDALARVLQRLFPAGDPVVEDGSFAVNNLKADSQPENCQVLLQHLERTPAGYRREHFLVRIEGLLLFLRVCTGSPNRGYQEFAIGQGVAATKREQSKLEKQARARLEALSDTLIS